MAKMVLGDIQDGGKFVVDALKLIDSRLLGVASSGGGKGWMCRKLIEELVGICQIVVIDVEGEFGTLREKYDFVLAGKGGDVSVDPRYADVLARKLLELRTDAILDLYELKKHERILFVKRFLEAVVNVPKELWHNTVFILDEAHLFAPEGGKSESLDAVVDLASRGRKRGFCLIPMTQRLAKLSKDVTAECRNKLIGLANQDIDRKRASEELGFTEKSAVLALRDMEPGEFYAVGPAFPNGVNRIKIGSVKTQHPKSGLGHTKVHMPAPTAKVRAILAKLADLPKEAQEEAITAKQMRDRIKALESELRQSQRNMKPITEQKSVAIKADTQDLNKAYAAGHDAGVVDGSEAQRTQYQKRLQTFLKATMVSSEEFKRGAETFVKKMQVSLDDFQDGMKHIAKISDKVKPSYGNIGNAMPFSQFKSRVVPVSLDKGARLLPAEPTKSLGLCERKILGFLNIKPGTYYSLSQIGVMTGYAWRSGNFGNCYRKLVSVGYVSRQGDTLALIADPGILNEVSSLVDGVGHRLEDWIGKLGKCERSIYEYLLGHPLESLTREELGAATGYEGNSGNFGNCIGHLNTLGLICRDGTKISLNPNIVGLT